MKKPRSVKSGAVSAFGSGYQVDAVKRLPGRCQFVSEFLKLIEKLFSLSRECLFERRELLRVCHAASS